jgi:hypothetical protein
MKSKKKFGVVWKTVYGNKGIEGIDVRIFMPYEVADMDRVIIEGIKNTIEGYEKEKLVKDK